MKYNVEHLIDVLANHKHRIALLRIRYCYTKCLPIVCSQINCGHMKRIKSISNLT